MERQKPWWKRTWDWVSSLYTAYELGKSMMAAVPALIAAALSLRIGWALPLIFLTSLAGLGLGLLVYNEWTARRIVKRIQGIQAQETNEIAGVIPIPKEVVAVSLKITEDVIALNVKNVGDETDTFSVRMHHLIGICQAGSSYNIGWRPGECVTDVPRIKDYELKSGDDEWLDIVKLVSIEQGKAELLFFVGAGPRPPFRAIIPTKEKEKEKEIDIMCDIEVFSKLGPVVRQKYIFYISDGRWKRREW